MKNATKILLTALVIFFFTGQTFSQSATTGVSKDVKKETSSTTQTGKFVDTNKNGICDNWEANHKDGKNCPNYNDCCKGKAGANCCGKANVNCQSTCKGQGNCGKGQGQAGCGKGQGSGCQHRHGQCPAKAVSTGK